MSAQRWDEAIACFEKAIELAPDNANALAHLGNLMRQQGRLDAAESLLRRSLQLQPHSPEVLVGMGIVLFAKGDLDASEALHLNAIALKPDYAAAHNSLGNTHRKQGRLDEAMTHYRRAIELNPDPGQAHTNLALLHLLRGQFAEGWQLYECRWKVQHAPLLAGKVTQPQWDGSDIAGKTMLLHAEQGLGDTLQFIRYVEPLAARGIRLVLRVSRPVRRLLEQSPVIARHQIIVKGDVVPPFDVHCPLLSLPMLMQTRLDNIPGGAPYLRADDADVAAWRALLAGDGATLPTMRIGVAWAGNKLHADDHNRSLSLAQLAPLLEAADDSVSFYSLQKGDVPDQAAALVAGTRLRPLPRELGDLADTAALMMNLDLIISVDTSVAHLAGGLGRSVWALLPFDPDWRWLLERADTPWYPTMRLFRQPRPRDWASVVAEVTTVLAILRRAGLSTTPTLQSLFANAVQHYQANRLDQADAVCRQILAQDAGHANALHMLAVLAMQSNRPDESERLLRQALASAPDNAEFLSNLGDLQLSGGRDEEAIANFQRVVDRQPDNAYAWNQLAGAFSRTGRALDAIASYERFIALDPQHAGAHFSVGAERAGRGELEEAIASFRKATVLQPDHVDAHVNLGVALTKLGRVDEAADTLRHAIMLAPQGATAPALLATAHNNLGISLKKQGRLDEALTQYQRATELNPDMAEAHTNVAMLQLLRGQFAEAWPTYEWRLKGQHSPLLAGKITQPQWDGSDIAGKTLLLHAEQGLGDTLQFIRYVEPLAARGVRLMMAVTNPVRRLLQQSPVIARHRIIAGEDAVPPFDVHCPLLSLPLAMQTRLETIPCGPAYLRADDADVATWRALLAGDCATLPTMRIGVAWAGNKLHGNDHNRSLRLAQLAPLFEAADDSVAFYSLQKGDAPGHIAALVAGTQLRPPPRELDDMADTAALMMNLDLIISVDTSVVHLAGGLGRPVWTLLPFDPDWRWLLERTDSPWYPTMRLFRQPSPGDWATVVARVAEALARLHQSR